MPVRMHGKNTNEKARRVVVLKSGSSELREREKFVTDIRSIIARISNLLEKAQELYLKKTGKNLAEVIERAPQRIKRLQRKKENKKLGWPYPCFGRRRRMLYLR